MRLRHFVVAITLIFVAASAWADRGIRVLLGETSAVAWTIAGPHRGYLDGLFRFETQHGLTWTLRAEQGRLISDGADIGRSLTLESHVGEVRWGDRRYRGSLRFVAVGSRVLVINVVEIEDYLRGVVPSEMQASWPMEALKAQAVAARTYSLSYLDPEADYDLCATIECQVYRGMEVEHPRSDQAVAETVGVVLIHQGRYARAYYHADSGGVVASSAEVWGLSLPYSRTQTDVAASSPHRNWQVQLDPERISSTLRDIGWEVGRVEALRVLAYSDSGRVARLQVFGSEASPVLQGATVQSMVRAWGLKSARFGLVGDLTVRGDGWGHGVGMSQYGARALANTNHSFGQILAFYYPDTELWRLTFNAAVER